MNRLTFFNDLQKVSPLPLSLLRLPRVLLLQGESDDGALRLGEVAALQVDCNDQAKRIGAAVFPGPGLDPKLETRPVPVAPVEHLALVKHDRLEQTARTDVGDESGVLVGRHLRN